MNGQALDADGRLVPEHIADSLPGYPRGVAHELADVDPSTSGRVHARLDVLHWDEIPEPDIVPVSDLEPAQAMRELETTLQNLRAGVIEANKVLEDKYDGKQLAHHRQEAFVKRESDLDKYWEQSRNYRQALLAECTPKRVSDKGQAEFRTFAQGAKLWTPDTVLDFAEGVANSGSDSWPLIRNVLERYWAKAPAHWRGYERQLESLLDRTPLNDQPQRREEARKLIHQHMETVRLNLVGYVLGK